jgi:hypothetical protein
MRELNLNEYKEVNGGVGSLIVLGVVGARAVYMAYKTNVAFRNSVNKSVKWVASAIAGGIFWEVAKEKVTQEQ